MIYMHIYVLLGTKPVFNTIYLTYRSLAVASAESGQNGCICPIGIYTSAKLRLGWDLPSTVSKFYL